MQIPCLEVVKNNYCILILKMIQSVAKKRKKVTRNGLQKKRRIFTRNWTKTKMENSTEKKSLSGLFQTTMTIHSRKPDISSQKPIQIMYYLF